MEAMVRDTVNTKNRCMFVHWYRPVFKDGMVTYYQCADCESRAAYYPASVKNIDRNWLGFKLKQEQERADVTPA